MLGLVLTLLASAAGGEGVFGAELIFDPNPKHNHGSSVVQTPDGDLLACWFHGSGERTADDVLIQGARKRAGSSAWSEPFLMADTPDLPDCNPVLFVDPRHTLWLFWITVQSNEWGSSLLKYRTATQYTSDGPPEWSWQEVIHCRPMNLEPLFGDLLAKAEPVLAPLLGANPELADAVAGLKAALNDKLMRRLGWMTRVHPIMTSGNRLLLGLYSDVFNCSLAVATEDWGATWRFSEPILTIQLGNIQPSFVPKRDGAIVAMMRDNGLPKRVRKSESHDAGITWGPVELMEIPNPGSSVECVALANGHWVLVCNDTLDGRHVLSAYLSEDDGASWPWSRRIEDMEKDRGSASYPSVIEDRDGLVHCTYSFTSAAFRGSSIKHAWFDEVWIRQ
ncbi:MAG TPA: exo-alpha-sialidase [Candidatus Hydrogenedentes bacterium]|nr:exo-alpha-sialidase [Candidatus Hydrogenedentota bacterium]HPG70288.1 exo-alpha-sialidase [Candidatus Hydrogenedentota bacterium]